MPKEENIEEDDLDNTSGSADTLPLPDSLLPFSYRLDSSQDSTIKAYLPSPLRKAKLSPPVSG